MTVSELSVQDTMNIVSDKVNPQLVAQLDFDLGDQCHRGVLVLWGRVVYV